MMKIEYAQQIQVLVGSGFKFLNITNARVKEGVLSN